MKRQLLSGPTQQGEGRGAPELGRWIERADWPFTSQLVISLSRGPVERARPPSSLWRCQAAWSRACGQPGFWKKLQAVPRGLGRHPPSDAKWRSVSGAFAASSGAQAIGTPASSHFPSSSPACLLPGKVSRNLMGLGDALAKNGEQPS